MRIAHARCCLCVRCAFFVRRWQRLIGGSTSSQKESSTKKREEFYKFHNFEY
jgi:hypothetical protein